MKFRATFERQFFCFRCQKQSQSVIYAYKLLNHYGISSAEIQHASLPAKETVQQIRARHVLHAGACRKMDFLACCKYLRPCY